MVVDSGKRNSCNQFTAVRTESRVKKLSRPALIEREKMATVSKKTVSISRIAALCLALLIFVFLAMFPLSFAAQTRTTQNWIATWTTANADLSNPVIRAIAAHDVTEFSNETYRGIVRTTIGGPRHSHSRGQYLRFAANHV